jgi:hypothetical protein
LCNVLTDTPPGHVLTRIICKRVRALALLHRLDEEDELLEELLAQKRWRRGKHGDWWDRRMTIAMKPKHNSHEGRERALNMVIAALQDPDTRLGELTHQSDPALNNSSQTFSTATQARTASHNA